MFILSEVRSNPHEFMAKMAIHDKLKDSVLFAQLVEALGVEKAEEIDPFQIMMNIMSLILFPFISRPMFEDVAQINPEEFIKMMEARKDLIPKWIMQMIS